MKQHQVIYLLVTHIVVFAYTFALVVMTPISNSALAQTGNNTDTLVEYQFITKWGTQGTEPGQFDGQNNVAGSGEFIYVPDYHNQRIQKFTNDGEFVVSWGSEGSIIVFPE